MERNKAKEKTPFNNRTKNESNLFEPQIKSIPYMFLSKHKHDGLILPDRAFAKGNAGKRCNYSSFIQSPYKNERQLSLFLQIRRGQQDEYKVEQVGKVEDYHK